jgi:hypothetical protein
MYVPERVRSARRMPVRHNSCESISGYPHAPPIGSRMAGLRLGSPSAISVGADAVRAAHSRISSLWAESDPPSSTSSCVDPKCSISRSVTRAGTTTCAAVSPRRGSSLSARSVGGVNGTGSSCCSYRRVERRGQFGPRTRRRRIAFSSSCSATREPGRQHRRRSDLRTPDRGSFRTTARTARARPGR